MNNNFTWIPFYQELSKRLLSYKDDRASLIEWIYRELSQVKTNDGRSLVAYLKLKDQTKIIDIDPFSVMSVFNRSIGFDKRISLLALFKQKLGIKAALPTDFDGVPTLHTMHSFFYTWEDNNELVIRDLWTLFEQVVIGGDIEHSFDQVLQNGMPIYSLTMCLFWICPEKFLALDSRNRSFLKTFGIDCNSSKLNFEGYTKLLEMVQKKIEMKEIPCSSFPEFSYSAWKTDTSALRVWMWSGDETTLSSNLLKTGQSANGFLDYSSFKTKKKFCSAFQTAMNNVDGKIPNAYWNFMHEVEVDDYVVVFKTMKEGHKPYHLLYGWGQFSSECLFDNQDEQPIQRNVVWHTPLLSNPIKDTKTNNQLFFHLLEGINADYIIKLLHMDVNEIEEDMIEKNYWWLVANPKIWSLSEMKIDEEQDYTLYNENGNPRRIMQNFINAKVGDMVIGYEATPTKQIVALLEISRGSDGKSIWFKKKETLGTPINYVALKDNPDLKKMEFFINPNGSLFKLSKEEFDIVMDCIREDNPITSSEPAEKYTDEDFLREVFLTKEQLTTMKGLLHRKKNLILQGAPGVGKTFAAKRLAYAMMGNKDEKRIEQVQFHQSYSYEDFMIGYKPNENGGFDLCEGTFYAFCKRAKADSKNFYFFIIDEINRGNLSKIFGELLMLIENDYREKQSITLPYRKEKFSVPSNLYIIGMMNTADRSLALIDYALRRRFSFFNMEPGFETDGFKNYMNAIDKNNQLSDVVARIKHLNETIANDSSLGRDFCIGHSYFCNSKSVGETELRDIIKYDIIPMLKEYWFDNEDRFVEESHKLEFWKDKESND